MRLFPSTTIKNFDACEHGEFLCFQVRSDVYSGVCIDDSYGNREVLILSAKDDALRYKLVEMSKSQEVESYGTDWTLSPYGRQPDREALLNEDGGLLLTSPSVYMVAGKPHGDPSDKLLCRLDAPDVRSFGAWPSGGFGYQYWRIHVYEKDIDARQKLAGKDKPEAA